MLRSIALSHLVNGYIKGITEEEEGFVGRTAEETVRIAFAGKKPYQKRKKRPGGMLFIILVRLSSWRFSMAGRLGVGVRA